jgi:hypothetical protein
MVDNNPMDNAIKCTSSFTTTTYDDTRVNLMMYRLYMDDVRLIDKYSPLKITLEEKSDLRCTDHYYEFTSDGLLRVGLKTEYNIVTKIPNLPTMHYSLDRLVLYGNHIKHMLSEHKLPDLLMQNPVVVALKHNTLRDNVGLYLIKPIINLDRYCE